MRKAVVLFLMATLSSPALGAEVCKYVNAYDQGAVVFDEDTATLMQPGADPIRCSISWGDESGHTLQCKGMDTLFQFSLSPSTIDGTEQDLLVMWNQPWHRQCTDGTAIVLKEGFQLDSAIPEYMDPGLPLR